MSSLRELGSWNYYIGIPLKQRVSPGTEFYHVRRITVSNLREIHEQKVGHRKYKLFLSTTKQLRHMVHFVRNDAGTAVLRRVDPFHEP